MYSFDYTKGLSGTLNKETRTNHSVYILINHILINLVFFKILENNTESNIATCIKSVSGFTMSAKYYEKIVSNFKTQDIQRHISSHNAEYVGSSDPQLKKSFHTFKTSTKRFFKIRNFSFLVLIRRM